MLAEQAVEDKVSVETGMALPAQRRGSGDFRGQLPTISACHGEADLRLWLLNFARSLNAYGARYIHIGTRWLPAEEGGHPPLRFLTTSARGDGDGEDWLARDPNAMRARTSFAPFAWSARCTPDMTPLQTAWLQRERERGVIAGIAVPIQDSIDGPGYLSLFGYDDATAVDLIEGHAPELAFVAAQFHVLAKVLLSVADWTPPLSEREIECLRLTARGKTAQECGTVLGVSKRTVEFHLWNAADKLGATTKLQAVILALKGGFV